MAATSIVALLLFGLSLCTIVLDNHLTEAKRSRLYRTKRLPAEVVDDKDVVLTGNCPPAPSAAHTKADCNGDFTKKCAISCAPGYVFPGQSKHHKFDVECDETVGFWEANGEKAGVPDCLPVCPVGCKNGGACSAPDTCTCPKGWEGKDCGQAQKVECNRILVPANAGILGSGSEVGSRVTAVCRPNHFFPGGLGKLVYECHRSTEGGNGFWEPIDGQGDGLPIGKFPDACIKAQCDDDYCKNGGTCVGPNKCECPPGTRGPRCEYLTKDCDCPKAPAHGAVTQRLAQNNQVTICEFSCESGFEPSGDTMKFNCRGAGTWKPSAQFPTCHAEVTTLEPKEPATTTIAPPKPPSTRDPNSDGFCYSYCQSSYRTFDNKRYEFNGKCRYVLAKDCVDNVFEIVVVNDADCDEGSDCHRQIIIKAGSATVFLEHDSVNGRTLVADEANNYELPYTVQNMEINEEGDMIEVTNDLGFALRWDKEQFISVEITKDKLKGKMCGLCGDYNGYPQDDFSASIKPGVTANTGIKFGLDNKVQIPGVTCDDDATSSYCKPKQRQDATSHCAMLKSGNFSECAALVKVDEFMSACVEAVCRYGQEGGINSACCAFEALVRECVRKGGQGAGSWKNEDFCPANCPAGQIYDDCGPNCVATCTKGKSICKNTKCVEGCRCPDGTVLHGGKCIAPTQCPCKDGDEEFEEGSVIKRDCNKCTCKDGSWDCTTKKCDAICEGNGDPHYRTFDGKNYDFMGDCRYYLVKSTTLTIIVENRKCGKQMSCTKSLRIIVGSTDIKLLPGKAIQVGDDSPQKVKEFRNGDVYYHPAGSIWEQLDIPGQDVAVQWDGVMAFKVIVPPAFIDRTKGLCGTYNKKQKDDFLTPEGDIETDANSFGNKWRTEDCGDPVPEPPECKDPALSNAKTVCAILKGDIFKKCRNVVDAKPDLDNCVVDYCNCDDDRNKKECICNDLRRYADQCERKGHGVGDWRSKVDGCGVDCPAGKVFKKCVNNCHTTCRAIALGDEGCKTICTEGCTCPDGEVEDNDGNCIPTSDCGCYANGKDYKKGEKTNQKDKDGLWLECICVGPHFKCGPKPRCDKKHEKWTDCKNEKCQPKCSSLAEDLICAKPDECEGGCECKDNYVRNAAGECVLKSQCECKHGGKLFPPGGKIKRECSNCVCVDGQWDCDNCQCAGTCTAWGDSHYTTFDGKKFEFAGKCEYTLVAGKGIDDVAFQVDIKNVLCGSSGVTCAKKITFSVLVQETIHKAVLTREGGVTISSDKVFQVRELGLYQIITYKHLGITLLWDKGTLLYVKLDGVFANKVEGLCGNFNGDELDDFKPRDGGSPVAEAHRFAELWQTNPNCEVATAEPPPKCETNEKKLFAQLKCGAMKSSLFASCHSRVDPSPYFDRCVHDTCACDFGGDCECLCTAISVYAELCAREGAPVAWRSQELCPIQCPCRPENATTDCPCYNPCIPLKPPKSCLNRFEEEDKDECDQESSQCVEGCIEKPCPPDMIRDPDGHCTDKCEGCGIHNGKLVKPGEPIHDPCCVCVKTKDGKDTNMKCYKDETVRRSRVFDKKYENVEGLKELDICQNGIFRGFESAGKSLVRAKCQCCPPIGPKPTCPPEHVPKLEEPKNKCPYWHCVCGPCPERDMDNCNYEKVPEKKCCPYVGICPDKQIREPCEDEIKECHDVLDPVCNITCKECKILCKACPSDPIPECGECEEVVKIPAKNTCGSCCPKFKCIPKTCDAVPTAACDSCHTKKQENDKCNCLLPPICEKNPCSTDPAPSCTSCQRLNVRYDDCDCPIYECLNKTCEIPESPECPKVCDKVIESTDICGCATLKCEPHVCVVEPNKTCSKCENLVTKRDECECLKQECVRSPCQVYPTLACDECHDLMVPDLDDCGCMGEMHCLPKRCPTEVPPTCDECEVLIERVGKCGCKEFACDKYPCPPFPNPNCTDCENKVDFIGKCGCYEPYCEPKVCPTYPPPLCDKDCEHAKKPDPDHCNCVGEGKCVKNSCPTVPPVTCTKCETKKTKSNQCGCKFEECEKNPCPTPPTPECGKCEIPAFVQADCNCSKPICKPKPIIPNPIPTCEPCQELVEWVGECGEKFYACRGRICEPITIPTCTSCEHQVNKTDDCNCLYSSQCLPNDCPAVKEPECKECHHVKTIDNECGCKIKTCERDPCNNYPSPNCTSCERLKNIRDKCDCAKQVCEERPCPPTPSPPACNPECQTAVESKDECGCLRDAFCKQKQCPTVATPTCNSCEKVGEKTVACGCKQPVCERKGCPIYPNPICTKCEESTFKKDECDCSKPICHRKTCPTPVPPTCSPCHKLKSKNDDCGCQIFECEPFCVSPTPPTCGKCETTKTEKDSCGCDVIKCVKKPCPMYPSPNCTKCQESAFQKDECDCSEPICRPKTCPTPVPPTCSPCHKLKSKNDDCGCQIFECEPFCVSPTPPTCGKCETTKTEKDSCGCDVLKCVKKPCPPSPTPSCSTCEEVRHNRTECGCDELICRVKPCPVYRVPQCDDTCEFVDYAEKDECDCYKGPPVCKKYPCPTSPPPTCSECQEIETVPGLCDCKEKTCKIKKCPNYKVPQCEKCFEVVNSKDNCNCSKPTCKPVIPPTEIPPTCKLCETLQSWKDECGGIHWTCKNIECHNVTIPTCNKCQDRDIKVDKCDCIFYAECKSKPCPTTIPPTCDSCHEPKPVFDDCDCPREECKRKPCVNYPSPNCSSCQIMKTVPLGCGCSKQVCEDRSCPTVKPPTCDVKCEKPVTPTDFCDCKLDGHCERKPCPTPATPTCTACQEMKKKLTEPCGCETNVCEKRPCPTYPTPICTDCERLTYGKDDCDCPKPACKRESCPTVVPPTCSACEKLEQKLNHCNCTEYSCTRYCPDPVIPDCPKCESPQPFYDTCGCQRFTCEENPCPEPPLLNCTECEKRVDKLGSCDCITSSCEKLPCKTYPDPKCNEECEFLDIQELDQCQCKQPSVCKKYPCPDSPPPTCSPCQELKNYTDKCLCPGQECKKRPCPIHPTPTCGPCERLNIVEDPCKCQVAQCVAIEFPTVVPPTCPPCTNLIQQTVECGRVIYDCVPEICPTNVVPPTCDDCHELVEEKSKCGCLLYAFCKPKTCPTQPPPTCKVPGCEHLVDDVGKCGCPVKKCDRIPCKNPPSPNCTKCDKIATITNDCGCQHQECQKRLCPTPIPPTCSVCEKPEKHVDDCGCESLRCVKVTCPTEAPLDCDPVCEKLVEENDICGCPHSKCDTILCKEPVMPKCGPCQVVMNKTDQCGCLRLECVVYECPVVKPPKCGECETVVEATTECGCKIYNCVPLVRNEECEVNGVKHPIGSSWPNEFDPKCSKCHCVREGKCLGAKMECEPLPTKDCLVFCKEGEWYYPPSKEECENTCGPCCGKCKPAKTTCNAVSRPVPANETVGILIMKKTVSRSRGRTMDCINKEEIHGLQRCSGACGFATYSEWISGRKDNSCKCCKTLETETKMVKMTCEDGTTYSQPVKNPTRCDCLPCETDHGGRK